MRIVLVGFMAAGKSTVGRRLADRLDWDFVDFDEAIRERTGKTAGAVIREDGEPAFRHLERDITRELSGRTRVVLAPGGGWGADPANATALGTGTIRVWLRVPLEESLRRAREDYQRGIDRPLLGTGSGAGGADAADRARALLETREQSYAECEWVVDAGGRDPDAVVEEILEKLRESGDA